MTMTLVRSAGKFHRQATVAVREMDRHDDSGYRNVARSAKADRNGRLSREPGAVVSEGATDGTDGTRALTRSITDYLARQIPCEVGPDSPCLCHLCHLWPPSPGEIVHGFKRG
jgi:hypothetical protein